MAHLFYITAYLVIAYLNYTFVIPIDEKTIGLLQFDMNIWYIFIYVLVIALSSLIIPRYLLRPSDFFLIFYVLLCVIYSAAFWPVTSLISSGEIIGFLVLLFLPPIIFIVCRPAITVLLSSFNFFVRMGSSSNLPIVLSLFIVSSTAVSSYIAGSGSFEFETSYERRLIFREVFSSFTLASYLFNMATFGVAPLLAFVASYRRLYLYYLVLLVHITAVFWLSGLKSPLINVIMLSFLGIIFRYKKISLNLPILASASCMVLAIVSILFYYIADSNLVADVILRRIIITQPQIQSYYYDLWKNLDINEKLYGVTLGSYTDVTFMVGDYYLDNINDNANVNTFFYFLVKNGLIGYALSTLAITAIFSFVDSLFIKIKNTEYFGAAAILSILIVEQSFTTSLLSSGVAICITAITLFSNKKAHKECMG